MFMLKSTEARRASASLPRIDRGAAKGSARILNLPAERYHASLKRYSCSTLKQMLISPAHYMAQFLAHRRPSAAMEFGSLVHLLMLEPWRLPLEYAVLPEAGPLSAAVRREAHVQYPGLRLLTEVQLHEARIAAEKAMERIVRGRPLRHYLEEGLKEVTYFYRDPVTRLPCRARLDVWHPDLLIDIKTTRHAELSAVSRACVTLSYDLQAYMYSLADALFHGCSRPREFVFVAIQSEWPHPVHVLTAGNSFLENGEAKYVRAMSLAYACTTCDYWPDNSGDGDLEIEPWQAFEASGFSAAAGAQDCDEEAEESAE